MSDLTTPRVTDAAAAERTAAVWAEPQAAYVHVPFCVHRCGYCDFTVVARKDSLIDPYLRALEIELAGLREPRPLQTLFLGGGTPTHLPAPQLRELLELLSRWLVLDAGAEFSIEANPAEFEDEKLHLLRERGINRVSLGVQSFDDDVLRMLERDHTGELAAQVVRRVRSVIPNVAVDLIFGVPGQTLEVWRDTLQRACDLEPVHISTYGLTYEKGTSFWGRRSQGTLRPVPEELEREMYALAIDMLTAAGFEQYELSNFARPGFRCRHNEVYWATLPYYGFGPGAASYLAGRRATNHRSVTTWLKRLFAGESPIGGSEQLPPEDRAREALAVGLRRVAGVSREPFRQHTGFTWDELIAGRLEKYFTAGLVERAEDTLRLTAAGRFLADAIIVDVL